MNNNQTPKYEIGQEVYVVRLHNIKKLPITGVRVVRCTDPSDTKPTNMFYYKFLTIADVEESHIYPTKEDIIKNLP